MPKAEGLQGHPLEKHSQVGERKAETLEGAFQALGRLKQPQSSDKVSLCKRSSRKNHPFSTCTREPPFQHHLQGDPYIHPSFTLRRNLGVVICCQRAQHQHQTPRAAAAEPRRARTQCPALTCHQQSPAQPCQQLDPPGFHSFGLGCCSFLRFLLLLLTGAEELLVCDSLILMVSVS